MLTFKEWLKLPEYARPANKLPINVGQYLEIAGAAMFSTGIYIVVGLGGALLAGAVFLVVAAELIYQDPVMIRLPTLRIGQRIKKAFHALRK